jgi:hypothetical protein
MDSKDGIGDGMEEPRIKLGKKERKPSPSSIEIVEENGIL